MHQLLSDERSAVKLILGMEQAKVEAAERGYNQAADLITETIDGIPINDLWGEFLQTILAWNEDRDALMALLSFSVSQLTERVFYPTTDADFEEASEFGVPKGIRISGKPFIMGYGFKWYDLAIRYTWLFLSETPADQIRGLNNSALEADNRLVFSRVFRRLFNPTNEVANIEDQDVNVYPLYNGDGTVPPQFRSTTFDGSHTHFLTSGAAVITSQDLDDIATHLQHHGYTPERGYTMIVMVNEQEGNVIRTFTRAGGAKWDFIPGPRFGGGVILPAGQIIQGAPAQNTGPIEDRIGTYGPFQVLEDYGIPPGYVVAWVTGGEDNVGNLVGIREHQNQSLRGLQLVKGRDNDYPLVDSYYIHGLGTGVRHRGAGVVMEITANPVYAPPPEYV
jgi:hypothetical protein